MGVVFVDGFDWAGSAGGISEKWSVSNSGTGLSLVTGRDGVGQALRWAAAQTTTGIHRPVPRPMFRNTNTVFTCGFAFRFQTLPTANAAILEVLGAIATNPYVAGLHITPVGCLGWKRTGVNRSQFGHAGRLQLNAWHHVMLRIEVEDQVGASNVTTEIWLDGESAIIDTNREIRNVDGDPVTDFSFGPSQDIGTFDVDDFWLIDPDDGASPTTLLGDVVVATVYPDGDGNTSAWTLFGGASDWQSVDEGAGVDHDGNTTYVSSQTLGQQSLFTFGAVPAATDAVVSAVAVNYVSSKENALGGPGFHAVKRTNTTTVVDSTFVMQSGQDDYVSSQKIWNTDGEDAAWTEATINSSEFGMEVES